MNKEVLINFEKYRNSLIVFAKRYKVPYEDIEEIVNDSILVALHSFDKDRGSFEAYCRVILKNRLRNFIRDHFEVLILASIDDKNEYENIYRFVKENLNKEEIEIEFKQKLSKIYLILDNDEKLFLDQIQKTYTPEKGISISDAARNIGIEPLKGWDLFRKIQRKARIKFADKISDDVLYREADIHEPIISYFKKEEPGIHYQKSVESDFEYGVTDSTFFSNFTKSLSQEQLYYLISIYK